MRDLARGFRYPFASFGFLREHPRLIGYILIPVTINLLVFGGVVYFGLEALDHFVRQWLPQGDAWYWALLNYLLWLLVSGIVAVVIFFTFVLVGSIIAAPFNDLLSEKTEAVVRGRGAEAPFRLGVFLRETLRTMFEEVRRLGAFAVGMIGILLLNVIPGVGQVLAAVLSFLFLLYFLVIDYTGFVLNRWQLNFREQRAYIRSRRPLMFGFGLGVFCLVSIPFLQLMAIPLAVIGATRLCCEHPPARGVESELS